MHLAYKADETHPIEPNACGSTLRMARLLLNILENETTTCNEVKMALSA